MHAKTCEPRAELDRYMRVYRISEQLSDVDIALDVIRCDPVWAKDMPATRYFALIHDLWTRGDRPLTPAEVGCALAHVSVLERVVESGICGLILEADMPLAAGQVAWLHHTLAKQPDLDFLHLQAETMFPLRGRLRDDGLFLADCDWDLSGGAAYLVSPRFAAVLVALQRKRLMRADDWRDFFAQDPTPPLHFPLFSGMAEGSTIEAERRTLQSSRLLPLVKRRLAQRLFRDRRRVMLLLGLAPPVIRAEKAGMDDGR